MIKPNFNVVSLLKQQSLQISFTQKPIKTTMDIFLLVSGPGPEPTYSESTSPSAKLLPGMLTTHQ